MRAGLYFTPPPGSSLTRAAALWLGRNAFDGEPTRAPDETLDPLVADPARYGFHATMKAPFRLASGLALAELDERLASFCASRDPVRIDSLGLAEIEGFLALVPKEPPASLAALEEAVVTAFEPFRAPASEQDLARRRPHLLTERQREHLERFGYPYVLSEFRFHMTLTGRLEKDAAKAVTKRLRKALGDLDGAPRTIDSLALFVEPAPGAPFRVHSLHPFRSPTRP
ncbi:DUF1045 domain-containing protein [Aurantimonas sp. Leaf443]|uniref:DUF1045 domain-containing protein n=1 Tax=Aurantimonas sp. Leaf443 TaxID=1736378 RepID=UPI0006F634B2|nr:DUF1045 domain-containing protein [Aurantimonas sp. Leaf443]KQT82175.1 hypothetical protein ASG48_16175 [Aurantimonas sp. Leaf443]